MATRLPMDFSKALSSLFCKTTMSQWNLLNLHSLLFQSTWSQIKTTQWTYANKYRCKCGQQHIYKFLLARSRKVWQIINLISDKKLWHCDYHAHVVWNKILCTGRTGRQTSCLNTNQCSLLLSICSLYSFPPSQTLETPPV